jgi:TolB protein
MNADGTSQTRLSPLDNTVYDTSPSFSPDGKQIVFFCWDGTTKSGIWTMSGDGSNRSSVIAYEAEAGMGNTSAFSPDGKKILWIDNNEVASVNLDGSNKITITNSGGKIYELMTLASEVWFTTSQDGNLEVYKMNVDGSGQKNMTNDPHADSIDMYVP